MTDPASVKKSVDDILFVRTDTDSDKSTLSYIEKKWIEHIYGEMKVDSKKVITPIEEVIEVKVEEKKEDDTKDIKKEDGDKEKESVSIKNNYTRMAVLVGLFVMIQMIQLPQAYNNIGVRTLLFMIIMFVVFNMI